MTFGEDFDPLGAHLQDPYPFYAQARKQSPVFWSPRMNAWVVTRYDDVFACLRDNDTFSNINAIRTIAEPPFPVIQEFMKLGYSQTLGIINADGELHKRLRAPYARNFGADRTKAAEPVMRAQVEASVDAIIDHGHVELMDTVIRPLPIAVIRHMYGVDEVTPEMIKHGTRGLLALQGNLVKTHSVEDQVEAVRAFVELCRVMRDVLYQRRSEPREGDLVSTFAAVVAPLDQPMTLEQESQAIFNLAGIYLPGHETTAPQLANGVRHLLAHQEQWALLCERPELIPQAVEEVCRYDTSVPGMFRLAKKATKVGGQEIPEGAEVFLALLSANRDEALTTRPEAFDITREPVRHLSFGYGAHYCIGAEPGRCEIQIALEVLTRRLPGMRLADRPVEIEPVFVTRGPLELHVEW